MGGWVFLKVKTAEIVASVDLGKKKEKAKPSLASVPINFALFTVSFYISLILFIYLFMSLTGRHEQREDR